MDLLVTATHSIVRTLRYFGGPGLVALGILSAAVPLPGSVDAAAIILAARHPNLWPYYAAMSVIGTVTGSYGLFRAGRHGGRGALLNRVSEDSMRRWSDRFSQYGAASLLFAGLAPPPFPVSPIIVVAGVSRYSTRSFLGWTTIARTLRYGVLTFAAATYGRRGLAKLAQHQWRFIGLILVIVAIVAIYAWQWKRLKDRGNPGTHSAAARLPEPSDRGPFEGPFMDDDKNSPN